MTAKKLPPHILTAIKSGIVPKVRNFRNLPASQLTRGEKVCRFIEQHLPIPEGPKVGQPCEQLLFQEVFIRAVFDAPRPVRRAILSMGRKGGKTALIANLLGAFMFMADLCPPKSRINSGALSREQASLIFNYLSKSISMSDTLSKIANVVPSTKIINAVNTGITYQALAADANRAMGLSPPVIALDELGQVVGPRHDFAEALLTSQGAYIDPLAIIISTQAASDADWLSLQIDDAIANPRDDVVCHVYEALRGCELLDEAQWLNACPALGVFRSKDDVRQQAEQAMRLPANEVGFRNLILNQRVALVSAYLAPQPWKECNAPPDLEVFKKHRVVLGLDLSARNDLTAAVLAAKDDGGTVHLLPFVFCPLEGITERSQRDRAPYDLWIKQGHLVPLGGAVMDYDQIAGFLRDKLEILQIEPAEIYFDRWSITHFKRAAETTGLAPFAAWKDFGQGFKDMSPACKAFEGLVLAKRLRHGSHPLLNAAAAAAIAEMDPAGNIKLAKHKSSTRIDPLVAAVMASFGVTDGDMVGDFNVSLLIG